MESLLFPPADHTDEEEIDGEEMVVGDAQVMSTMLQLPNYFLNPSDLTRATCLANAKSFLDPVAQFTSQLQEIKLQTARRKRKRGKDVDSKAVLRLEEIYTEGFGISQIWEQARRILESSSYEIQVAMKDDLANKKSSREGEATAEEEERDSTQRLGLGTNEKALEGYNEGSDITLADQVPEPRKNLGELEHDKEPGDEDMIGKEGEGEGEDENEIEGEDEDEYIEHSDTSDEEPLVNHLAANVLIKDKHGLNDGFFSIDEFNRASEFLEQRDTRGSPDGDETVDWEADPLAGQSLGKNDTGFGDSGSISTENSSEDLNGRSFGNANLDSPPSEASSTPPSDAGDTNTNDIRYNEFFAPPARAAKAANARRSRPIQPTESIGMEEDDIRGTMSAARRDIFEDEPEESDKPTDETGPLSSHQKRQSALKAQILALEAASVAKRGWQLSGETRAAQRPLNSLLNETIDFEGTGKPVPIITAAISEDLESLIKRRILAKQFDEVLKRRPEVGDLTGAEPRRGRVELDDRKSGVGLAELYEDDHLRATDLAYVDKRDASLKAQHEAIESAWRDISGKLDALTNWNFRPKPPDVSVKMIEDVSRITMEDARPAGVVGIAGDEGRLAPQEVFRVGEKEAKEEGILARAGGTIAREEMTREEKLRKRRREKERLRKSSNLKTSNTGNTGGTGTGTGKGARSGTAEQEKQVLDELKKGAVRVIGKRGELKALGKTLIPEGVLTGGRFKL